MKPFAFRLGARQTFMFGVGCLYFSVQHPVIATLMPIDGILIGGVPLRDVLKFLQDVPTGATFFKSDSVVKVLLCEGQVVWCPPGWLPSFINIADDKEAFLLCKPTLFAPAFKRLASNVQLAIRSRLAEYLKKVSHEDQKNLGTYKRPTC